MIIYGIDPGTYKSAIVKLEMDGQEILSNDMKVVTNRDVENILLWEPGDKMIYEWVQNYGRVVGQEVLKTCYWCGRFAAQSENAGMEVLSAKRPEVVRHFTGQTNVPKPHVRQAVLDRFGGTKAKRKGGVLYGVSNHTWDALALIIYILEEKNVCNPERWTKGRSSD